MNIKNKPLPRFEVPSSYEKYAEGGYLMDVREPEADSFGDRKPTIASGAGAAAVDPAAIVQGAAADAEYELPDEPTFADREHGGHVRRFPERAARGLVQDAGVLSATP